MHILTLVLMLNLKIFKNTALFEEIWEIILLKKYKNSSRSFTVLLWTSLRVLHCPWEKNKIGFKEKKKFEKIEKNIRFLCWLQCYPWVSTKMWAHYVPGVWSRGMVPGVWSRGGCMEHIYECLFYYIHLTFFNLWCCSIIEIQNK